MFDIRWLLLPASLLLTAGIWNACKKIPRDRLQKTVPLLSGIVVCISAWWLWTYPKPDAAEQQRTQTMFSADRARPLDSLYAVFDLDRVYDPRSFEDFCFTISIYRSFGNGQQSTITLITKSAMDQPPGNPRQVPGMLATVVASPVSAPLTNAFVYGYVQGLSRIELGVFRPAAQENKIKMVDDLDRAMISISGTRPLNRHVRHIILVANNYVVVDLKADEMRWRQSIRADFFNDNVPGKLVSSSETIGSNALLSLNLPEVPATRRKRILDEIVPGGSLMQYVNMSSDRESRWGTRSKQHGWMVLDSDSK